MAAEKLTTILNNSVTSINERMTAVFGGGWIWTLLLVALILFVVPGIGAGIGEEETPE